MNHLDNFKLLQQCQFIVIVIMKTISHQEVLQVHILIILIEIV
jgi:hypothetical protein